MGCGYPRGGQEPLAPCPPPHAAPAMPLDVPGYPPVRRMGIVPRISDQVPRFEATGNAIESGVAWSYPDTPSACAAVPRIASWPLSWLIISFPSVGAAIGR